MLFELSVSIGIAQSLEKVFELNPNKLDLCYTVCATDMNDTSKLTYQIWEKTRQNTKEENKKIL